MASPSPSSSPAPSSASSAPKSWQARISEATDALAQTFVESISYDRRLYRHDIAGSLAHAAMLTEVGLLSESDRAAIETGLKSIQADIDAGNFTFDASLEDIHMVVEKALIDRVGEPGRRLHTARSRNDQVALDLLLWLNDAAVDTERALSDACQAFLSLAERSVDVVMPSYTHLQRAQPISAAAECLAWCTMLYNDRERLRRLTGLRHPQRSPLGSGAIAGSSLPIDPDLTVSKLPHFLDEGPVSSIYHTGFRDEALDYLWCLAMTAQHLSRFAEQWVIYMSTEFSFLTIADRYTTSSSMMPQKRNPDMLELIRGRCGNVYGDLFALMTILKGLPIGYNRDLQEDKRLLFRAHDTLLSCLTIATAIVGTARFNAPVITPTLDRGFLDATALAEYFVTQGVPFRTAHHIVGSLVATCDKLGKPRLSDLTLPEMQAIVTSSASLTLTEDVYRALGAANVVSRYKSPGAAGGTPLQKQLAEWRTRLEL